MQRKAVLEDSLKGPTVCLFAAIAEVKSGTSFFLSMDPLYPPGLDENRAVDDLYPASWICSEITFFVLCSRLIKCSVQNLFRCSSKF